MKLTWTVTETPCYPNAYKVHPLGSFGSNWPTNFFPTALEAWNEAAKRNAAQP